MIEIQENEVTELPVELGMLMYLVGFEFRGNPIVAYPALPHASTAQISVYLHDLMDKRGIDWRREIVRLWEAQKVKKGLSQ